MKRTIIFGCAMMLFLTMCIPASATTDNSANLRYGNINTVSIGFTINSNTGVASCSGYVESHFSLPVEVLVQLQVYKNGSWKTLRSWSNTGTVCARATGQYTVESGYDYRVKVTGYICNDLGLPIESETGEKVVSYPAN